ncbi:MAG: hypothetical protein VW268_10195 [Rhodospirillaceae bacterium]
MSGYDLAYVALSTSDPKGVATVLAGDLGMAFREIAHPGGDVRVFTAGRSGISVFGNDHPLLDRPGQNGLDHIALVAGNPHAAAKDHGLAVIAEPDEEALGGGVQARLDPDHTRGVRTRFIPGFDLIPAAEGMIERIDHLGVASGGVRGDEAVFCANLGFAVESRQTDMEIRTTVESFTSDKYGVVYHNRPPEPQGGLRVLFVTVGDTDFEFLEEFDPNRDRTIDHNAAGTTKQDQSAIGRYIEKRGPGLHHIALKATDINGTLAHLAGEGRRMIDMVGRPGSRRALIGFVHPAAMGGVLLHLVERPEME